MARDIPQSLRQALDNDRTRMILATAAGELIRRTPLPRRKPAQPIAVLAATEEHIPPPVLTGVGGFAVGAGAATLVPVAFRGIGKLVRNGRHRALFSEVPKKAAEGTRKAMGPPLEAVDAFASRLGGGSKRSASARQTAPAKQTAGAKQTASAKRTAGAKGTGGAKRTAGAKQTAPAKRTAGAKRATPAKRTPTANAKRTTTANAKPSTTANAKRSTTANAKRSTTANAKRTSTASGSSARTPARRRTSANGSNGQTASKSASRKPART